MVGALAPYVEDAESSTPSISQSTRIAARIGWTGHMTTQDLPPEMPVSGNMGHV